MGKYVQSYYDDLTFSLLILFGMKISSRKGDISMHEMKIISALEIRSI